MSNYHIKWTKNPRILEINTLGGRLDSAIQIRDSLLNSKVQTIAYINKRAISAGALISLACQYIVMVPGSTIGAATPVAMNPLNPLDSQMKPVSEKIVSYFRNEMKATAEKNGRPGNIAEAMVDADVTIEGIIEKGKLLTLTSKEAITNKVADYLDAHFGKHIDFFLNDCFRQSKFRDSIYHYSAWFVECFKYSDIVACPSCICGCDYSTRPGAYNSDFFTRRRRNGRDRIIVLVKVGYISFEPTYRDCFGRVFVF